MKSFGPTQEQHAPEFRERRERIVAKICEALDIAVEGSDPVAANALREALDMMKERCP